MRRGCWRHQGRHAERRGSVGGAPHSPPHSPPPTSYGPLHHADARRSFFEGRSPKLLIEARFAGGLTARGYPSKPAFDGAPLELVFSPRVAEAEQAKVSAAIAAAQHGAGVPSVT